MSILIDLTGQRFGRLTVVSRAESVHTDYGLTIAMWNCVCDCGNKKTVKAELLRNGKVKSCGCLKHEHAANYTDLTGMKFGRLLVLGIDHKKYRRYFWKCRCECGNESVVSTQELKSGHTKSCGCWKADKLKEIRTTNGLSYSRIRYVWAGMIKRCKEPDCEGYENYGGRGISVCPEWHDLRKFADWAYENGYNENAEFGECTLDRIDVNGNYEPSNCRFVNMKVQCNNKRNNINIEYKGEKHTIQEWSDITGINRNTLRYRSKTQEDIEKVFSERSLVSGNKLQKIED